MFESFEISTIFKRYVEYSATCSNILSHICLWSSFCSSFIAFKIMSTPPTFNITSRAWCIKVKEFLVWNSRDAQKFQVGIYSYASVLLSQAKFPHRNVWRTISGAFELKHLRIIRINSSSTSISRHSSIKENIFNQRKKECYML